MFITLKGEYSLICEKKTISFFNLESKTFEFILKADIEAKVKFFNKLNYPQEIKKENGILGFIQSNIFRGKLTEYFEIIDDNVAYDLNKKYERIKGFIKDNKKAFKLMEGSLFSIVKKSVFTSKFKLVGSLLKDVKFSGLNTEEGEFLPIEKDKIYIIDSGSVMEEELKEFEKQAFNQGVTRIYVAKENGEINIGPGLFGKDFGCYFCTFNNKKGEKNQSDSLIIELLDRELLKITPNIVESLIEDNTISKGKVFQLNTYDYSAKQIEMNYRNSCKIHKYMDLNDNDYYKTRWKEKKPEETVEKIEAFLKERGIEVIRRNKTKSCNFHAILLQIKGTDLFVNGKGGTEMFALASGYGELMERLNTGALFRFKLKERDNDMTRANYYFVSDEILVDKYEFERLNFFEDLSFEKILRLQKGYIFQDKVILEPMRHINKDEIAYFPVTAVDVCYGTNGMSYGNTRDEAKVQALSEIFERYSNSRVIKERLSLPDIPREWLMDDLNDKINNIEKTTTLRVRIMDASLDQGLPVVSIMIEDITTGKYFIKFGSHFDLSVAVERCLTELFQGRTIKDTGFLREKVYIEDEFWKSKNLESILHTGNGYYPQEIFIENDLKPKKMKKYVSNKETVEEFEKLLLKISDNIYYKEYLDSCGFVIKYLVPGVSEITMDMESVIDWQINLSQIKNRMVNMDNITKNELEETIDFISMSTGSKSNTLFDFLPHNLTRDGIYNNFTFGKLLELNNVFDNRNIFIDKIDQYKLTNLKTDAVLDLPISFEKNIIINYNKIRNFNSSREVILNERKVK